MAHIIEDDLRGPEIAALLREHVQSMHDTSPVDSIHTLSLDELRSPDITLWTAWQDSELLACGALKELDSTSGEIKSMRTASAQLGRGYASEILQHIVGVACERGYSCLYLETGSAPAFAPAHALYRKAGFTYCEAFADYEDDPFSRFMVLPL